MKGRQPRLSDIVTSDERRQSYLERGLWDGTTLAERVAAHAVSNPLGTAVIDDLGAHNYTSLGGDAAALAQALADRGVGPGDVVSIQLPNWYEATVAAVAVQSLEAVINPLLPNYRAHELTNVFTTARPAAIFTPAAYRGFDHVDLVRQVAEQTGVRPFHVVVRGAMAAPEVDFEILVRRERGALPAPGSAEEVSELIFTSGTEARPKAIMHTEQTVNFSVRVAHADLGVGAGDVVWMPSPVGHSTGFNYGTRFALYHGLPLVLQDRWDPEAAVRLVSEQRCSYTLAATTFLEDLVGAARASGATLPSLRLFGCGGAPVPETLVDAAEDRGIEVLRLYGSTEVLVATWNRPSSSVDQRRLTDGTPMTHVEVELRDDEGSVTPPGEAGEIYVRGPNTCVGFFDDPERTKATFDAEGWIRSGDLATMDDDGHLTVVGRKKEILIRGGLNIAPREIEDLLVTFPEVERAAIVGLPDPRLGERMCACIVPVPGMAALSLSEVVQRLEALGLATYKLPERLEVLDALPTTASGKVQKHEIVRALTGGIADDC